MKEYQRDFIDFCIANDVLKFGEFTLKSGRKSPYFFNAGLFSTGKALSRLGEFYAAAIQDHSEQRTFDVLFGPAYKGIPLVSSTSISLFTKYNVDMPFAFNRKEAKTHGEGGNIVGSQLKGNVLIVDDVITAGTAIRESVDLIAKQPDAKLSGVVISLDRQEKGTGELSAIQQVERDYNIRVISIVSLSDVLQFLKDSDADKYSNDINRIQEYRKQYGV